MAKNYFILELKLNTNKNHLAILAKRFNIAENMYNKTLKFALKQLKRMRENKVYKKTLTKYIEYKEINDKENIKLYSDLLNSIRLSYSLSEYQLHSFIKVQQNMYKKHIDSNTSQKIASTVWKAIEDVLYKKGKKVHFKKRNTLISVEGKTNKSGIRFINNSLSWNKLNIPVKVRRNDLFIQESLENNKIKYCRIIRKPFKNGYKYFLQLIMEGLPPTKRIHGKVNTGSFRHTASPNEKVGIDIGASTIAVCSKSELILQELAPNSRKYDKEIYLLQRKIERSKRATNPFNFNVDGTIKRGIKLKWVYSKNYYKLLFKLKNLYRLKSNYIKLEHNKLSNKILSLGNKVYVETMRFNALQKRSKETTINKKTGKFNKKKRFGKSLNNKAPSLLLSIIDRKLKYENLSLNKVNTITFKASQYNHVEDKYIKKSLNQRWNKINGEYVQRDLYSSFLIMNSKDDLKECDKSLCDKTYEEFKIMHNKLIEAMKIDDIKYPNSLGIKKII